MKKKLAVLIVGAVLFVAGLVSGFMFFSAAKTGEESVALIDTHIKEQSPYVFTNSTAVVSAKEDETYSGAFCSYKTPEGISIVSYSTSWNEEGLVLLYEELLRNKHGKEIETLQAIILHAEESESILGQHTPIQTIAVIEFSFGALSDGLHFSIQRSVSVIEIYDADKLSTIESISRTLSHEYGHLYTFYYFFTSAEGSTLRSLATTRYAELRRSEEYDLISLLSMDRDEYMREHHRVLFEVAAEDYIQIMGSPTTRQVIDFPDVSDQLYGREYPVFTYMSSATNAWPQANMVIPFASEVDGLTEYFYSFIDEEPPTPEQPKQEITIGIERRTASYNLVGGYQTFVHHVLSWNAPYQDALYTLVCYEPENAYMVYPIRTISSGESASATIGSVTSDMGSYINIMSNELNSGTKVFFVVAMLPDGSYYRSEPLWYEF